MEDDNEPIQMSQVIKFKPRENGDVLAARPPSECRHYSFEVDEEAGEVTCDQCQKQLDPIFVLMRLTSLYKEQDYKYDKILEFERESRERAARQRERYAKRRGLKGSRV